MTTHPDPRCGDCEHFDHGDGVGNTWPRGRCALAGEYLTAAGYPADMNGYEVTATTPCPDCPDFSMAREQEPDPEDAERERELAEEWEEIRQDRRDTRRMTRDEAFYKL